MDGSERVGTQPWCCVNVAVLDGKIYALGGYDGDRRTNTAERCDPVTNTWSLIADMNDQRSDACATVVDSKVRIRQHCHL
ncbi:hypothetical protein MRX96_017737 [Rhipicephalus microplus]